MEERKPLVSVIVPVYNVYPYLRDCVQSVQAQSYQNWELLLVDDGSTDGSGELCDELTAEDGRIQVFHKPNGGQSDARNVGLQQTQGKYFYLLDSDDLIRSTAFDQFVERCEADGADAALTPLEMFSTEQPEGRTENHVNFTQNEDINIITNVNNVLILFPIKNTDGKRKNIIIYHVGVSRKKQDLITLASTEVASNEAKNNPNANRSKNIFPKVLERPMVNISFIL